MRCSQRALLSRWLRFYARTRPVRPIFFPSSYVSPSLHPAAIAPAAPVAELGVVRRRSHILKMNTERKHLWYHIEPVVLTLGCIFSLIYWCVAWNAERTKTHLEYVRLAIGVLQPTEKDKQPQKELRSWAVEILQDSSPVKLSTTAAQALIDGEANFGSVSYEYGYSSPLESAKREPKAKSQ